MEFFKRVCKESCLVSSESAGIIPRSVSRTYSRSYYGETYLEWTLDLLLLLLRSLLDYILPFPHYKALPFLFDYLPSAYLFSAQLWSISKIILFPFVVILVSRSNPLWSPSSGAHREGSFRFLRELSSLLLHLLILLHVFPIKHPIKRLITLTTLLERTFL